MSAALDRFKIGLLVILGFVAVVLITIGLGVEVIPAKSVTYRSYFDESVQGLDVGAPVKLRGISIGKVGKIALGPDRRRVEVVMELTVDELRRLGVAAGPGRERLATTSDLRAQVATLGVSGIKFVDLVFADERAHPPPALPFAPPDDYIPSMPSTLFTLELAARDLAAKLPALVDTIAATAGRVERMLAELERDRVSERVSEVLAGTDDVLRRLDRTLRGVDRARLGERSSRTLDDLDRAVAKLTDVLERMGGEGGLVASATRAVDSIRALGRGTSHTARELESTMRGLREAADAVRVLAETLERDPDMLLKGRAKATTP